MSHRRFALVALLAGSLLGAWGYGCRPAPLSADSPPLQLTAASETNFGSEFRLIPPSGESAAKSALKYATGNGSSPGQLEIRDKKGKPTGVCPLQHTDVSVDIAGYVSRVKVSQEFVNPTQEAIEAIYTFPLPDDAAVDDMTMTIGDRVIKGQILRREEAREVYETAKTAGQAAALLDQERPNIFTQSVANILPGAKITITIHYVNLLKYEDGVYEFVFPMVVGPRYTPSGGYTVPGKRGNPSRTAKVAGDPGSQAVVTDADKITPPITPPNTRAGHDISLNVRLDAGLPLQNVRSVLHPIQLQRADPKRAVLRLENKSEIPNRDFILRYTAAGAQMQSGLLAYAPDAGKRSGAQGGGYFTLIIQPPMAPPRKEITPKEMVFVIDQTGSQSGWPIQKAKETMRHCIQSLNPGDTFQLLGFNTQLYPCFPAPVPRTPENVQRALQFLNPIEGGGGTDILKAVDYALKLKDDPDRLRIICYMTDGFVGNDMQIIDYVRKYRGRARMFPFGVGNSVNRFLIEGMAREGRGATEYVTLNKPGEEASARFYHRVADPLLLDIHIDWNGLPVEDVFPRHIPDVFRAGPILVKGRYTRPGEGDITVRGLLRGKPWSQTLHVVLPAAKPENSALATLWAREKIEDLQSQDWLGEQTGNPNQNIQENIVATALKYRLMSQHTSFVAVEQRVINVGGKTRQIDVPVEMPEGVSYEGIFGDDFAEGHVATRGLALFRNGGNVLMGRGGLGGVRTTRRLRSSASASATPGFMPSKKLAKRTMPRSEAARSTLSDAEIAVDEKEGLQRLKEMKPEERRAYLTQIKLVPALQGLAAKVKKEGKNGSLDKPGTPKVENGKVEVQIALNSLPPGGLEKLKALGFDLYATLRPGKLLYGAVEVEKLDALIELDFLRRIELPRNG